MISPRLTVICVTYNHEKYIAKALDSFISQQADFPFQVLVGDDASTDKTAYIIADYAQKYPGIIKPVFRQRNIGAGKNSVDLYNRANTEFVAICDGDDYWTDTRKLQKQVDFLKSHPGYNICFHPVHVLYKEKGLAKDFVFPNPLSHPHIYARDHLAFADIARANFIQSSSVLYRWKFPSGLPSWYGADTMPGDWCLMLLHADDGFIKLLPDIMAVYLRHPGGLWWGLSSDILGHYLKHGLSVLNIFRQMDLHCHGRHNAALLPILEGHISYLAFAYLWRGDKQGIKGLKSYLEAELVNYRIDPQVFSPLNYTKTGFKVFVRQFLGANVTGVLSNIRHRNQPSPEKL